MTAPARCKPLSPGASAEVPLGQAQPRQPRRVLIVKPSALGDVVSTVPVLRGLRRTFPDAHISWLLSPACSPLVAGDPDLDEVIPFERKLLGRAWRSGQGMRSLAKLVGQMKHGRFDWVLDLQGLLRSQLLTGLTRAPLRAGFAQVREGVRLLYTHSVPTGCRHAVDRNIELARRLGVDARPEDFSLHVAGRARLFADELADARDLGEYVICVPPTRWATKLYPTRHWRSVVAQLAQHRKVVLVGAPGERHLVDPVAEGLGERVVNLAGQTDVEQLVGVIARSAGVVCCDSAAMYIAPAVGVKVLALIGPTRIERTGPYRLGKAVSAPVPCRGCLRRVCSHAACMELIAPSRVAGEAMEMFSQRCL
jgi:lipopolysaccharide heptosyltransferase I